MKKMYAIFCLSLCLFASACRFMGGERIKGNGSIKTEPRTVGSFNGIDASGSVNVHLQQSSDASVKIEADENLLPYIETSVSGSTLKVKTRDGFNLDATKGIVVYVSGPVFREASVSGSGDIIGDNVITGTEALSMDISGSGNIKMEVALPKTEVEISGSGSAELRGSSKEFKASISGSGSIHCFELITDNTTLDLSGASDAQVYASKRLKVEVSGSGDVQYKGGASVSQDVSGSGSVKKVD
jgi:hypothetical protein